MPHQLPDPLSTVREIVRVTKPQGALLVRDVRRLPAAFMNLLLPLYCLRYGRMLRSLTYASYRAGLTLREFSEMAREAKIERARITRQFITHQSLERPAAPFAPVVADRTGPWALRVARGVYVSPRSV